MIESRIHASAEVAESAKLSNGVQVWQFSHIREHAILGENVIIGRGVYIGPRVTIGKNSKIQNYSLIYEPALIESGVFVGPSVVLTNDLYPRAINPDGSLKTTDDWIATGVKIREGASIGANSVCVAPVEIGAWSMVAAGSTVVKDVPPFALVAGSPAKKIRWVGKAGLPLEAIGNGKFKCPKTGDLYLEIAPDILEAN